MAAYSGNSARIAFNSASCSKRETETRRRWYAVMRCSSAVLYRERHTPNTRPSSRSCLGVGISLYLYDLRTTCCSIGLYSV